MRILKNFRQAARTLWGGVLMAGLVFAGGCSRDDNFGPDGVSDTAVTFTAGIEQAATTAAGVPQTRTTGGGDRWLTTDAVGIFVLTTGGTLPGDVVSGADNVRYTVTDVSAGTLSGGPVYYPQSGNADFVAYYPYGTASAGATAAGTVNTTDYTYNISLAGQTDAAAQNALDVLYARKTNIAKSGTAVNLAFGHVLSKVTLDVKAGEGIAQADIQNLAASSVEFGGMPQAATLGLQDGRLTAGAVGSFNPVKAATATATYDATFTALVVPQNGTAGRTMVFTVDGKTYTGPIPDTDAFRAGKHYTYPVTVSQTGLIVGTPTINKWTENPGPGTVAGTEMEFVKIPAGTFKMGSSDGSNISGEPITEVNTDPNDPLALYYEKPQHWVEITKAFYMSKYEVTNSQYAVFLNANGIGENGEGSVTYDDSGSSTTATKLFINKWPDYGLVWSGNKWVPVSGYENHPVVYVTWYGAKAFADYYGYSLPTEAQWEYACRAGTTTVFSYGDSASGDYMWYSGNNNPPGTKAVGTKQPNLWGLYDMHGNVSEWCLDQWDVSFNYPAAATKDVAKQDPLITVGSFRILRGGFWNGDIGSCRSANRSLRNPDGYNFGIGFRVVVVP